MNNVEIVKSCFYHFFRENKELVLYLLPENVKWLTILTVVLLLPVSLYPQSNNMKNSERYARGWEKLKEIDGEGGEKVINGLKDISPDLSRFIIEYSFGDVYSMEKLDDKSKEIAAVSSLITQSAIPQLKVHLNGALNTGCSITEVKELILHSSVYVGFPKAINAMNVLKEVLEERSNKGIKDNVGLQIETNRETSRYETGSKYLGMLDDQQVKVLKDAFGEFSPDLVRFVVEYGYGDIYSRESLSKKYRQIASIAILTTSRMFPQLKFHISAGLNVGLSADEIKEIMLLTTVYSGFPSAINGTNMLKEVLAERGDK